METELRCAQPTLLVVDDEERILSALRRTLRREGYQIVTSESVHEALEILDARPVELILSDQKMPGMSGLQFLEEAAKRCPGAARMLITGWTEEIPAEKLEELGIRGLITKPWDDARLKEVLRQACDAVWPVANARVGTASAGSGR
jgi:response regulator RpfG family c-di-GMP phosphodiesterase